MHFFKRATLPSACLSFLTWSRELHDHACIDRIDLSSIREGAGNTTADRNIALTRNLRTASKFLSQEMLVRPG